MCKIIREKADAVTRMHHFVNAGGEHKLIVRGKIKRFNHASMLS